MDPRSEVVLRQQDYLKGQILLINAPNDQLIKNLGLKPVDREKFDADYSSQQKYDVLKNFAQLNVGDYEAQALNDANKAINQQAEQQLNSAEVITDSDGQSIDLQ